jgi:glycine betaine/choline ABC-type transport system substrate-binding protein
MQELNYKVDQNKQDVKEIVLEFLEEKALL